MGNLDWLNQLGNKYYGCSWGPCEELNRLSSTPQIYSAFTQEYLNCLPEPEPFPCDTIAPCLSTLVPYILSVGPGGSSLYAASNDMVYMSWTGGSGTHTLTLPSAVETPYRFIRFVNGGTVSASNKIDITAPVGQTIDGVASYEINKSYNGCAVWSDSNNWIVIQAKST